MNSSQDKKNHIRLILLILSVLLLTRVLFIFLMPATYSKDLYAWLNVIDVLKNGGNPYRDTGVLNWPPFWMQLIYGVGRIAGITSLPAAKLFQALLIGGECAVVVVCYSILTKFFRFRNMTAAFLAAFAISPICVFLNCQHGNFDVFVGLWILLYAYALLSFYGNKSPVNWLAACFFLGMGILTKTVPFILSPLLLIGIQKQEKPITLFGLVLLLAPVTIGMSIIYTLSPAGVSDHVLGYRSMAGWYGISGMLNVLGADTAIDAYGNASAWFISCLMLIIAWRVRKVNTLQPEKLVTALFMLLVFVPTFGPGYSPPYILWYLPLMFIYYVSATPSVKKFMMAGYIVLAATYITEYAFFNSHGAFMKFLDPSDSMAALCGKMGASKSQSLIRLPMFITYIIFYGILLRDKNNVVTHNQNS